jgi:protein-disulfide isomerase
MLIGLVIGVGAIGYLMMSNKATSKVVDMSGPLPPAAGQVRGSASAPVEIVEYGDFECPQCGRFSNITEPDVKTRLIETGAARFRFMDFPLQGHPSTMFAHDAAACAAKQGKFWEMHDRIFQGQLEWSALVNNRDMNAPKVMKRYAKELGLDTKDFNQCFEDREFAKQIKANYDEGIKLNVQFTPTFIIGKRMITGAQPYDVIKALVDSATTEANAAKPLGDTAKKAAVSQKKGT